MASSTVPTFQFLSGNSIPVVGLGTWKTKAGQAKHAVKDAIDVGYRYFDCAYGYENREIGEALQESIAEGVVERKDLFITSKLRSTYTSDKKVEKGFRKSLKALKLDYLDLYLIHWPVDYQEGDDDYPADEGGKPLHTDTDYLDTWKALEKLQQRSGQIKDIGVSNFSIEQLQLLIDNCETVPACNQIEVHVYLQNKQLVDYCQQKKIIVVAYSPLGCSDRPKCPLCGEYRPPLEDAKVINIAQKHGKQPEHVLLRFLFQLGLVAIPKSINKNRMKSNLELSGFTLDADDMSVLEKLDRRRLYCGCTMASLVDNNEHISRKTLISLCGYSRVQKHRNRPMGYGAAGLSRFDREIPKQKPHTAIRIGDSVLDQNFNIITEWISTVPARAGKKEDLFGKWIFLEGEILRAPSNFREKKSNLAIPFEQAAFLYASAPPGFFKQSSIGHSAAPNRDRARPFSKFFTRSTKPLRTFLRTERQIVQSAVGSRSGPITDIHTNAHGTHLEIITCISTNLYSETWLYRAKVVDILYSDISNVPYSTELIVKVLLANNVQDGGTFYSGMDTRIASALRHENLVRHHFQEIQLESSVLRQGIRQLWVCMEYCEGGCLREALRHCEVNSALLQKWTRQILLGLEYLHEKQIFHGDISGSHILLTSKDYATCTLKIASLTSVTKPEQGCSAKRIRLDSTASYVSPEMFYFRIPTAERKSFRIGSKTDIWSFGCLFISILTLNENISVMSDVEDRQDYDVKAETLRFIEYLTDISVPNVLKSCSLEIIDFALRCLELNPQLRSSATDLLDSQFFASDSERLTWSTTPVREQIQFKLTKLLAGGKDGARIFLSERTDGIEDAVIVAKCIPLPTDLEDRMKFVHSMDRRALKLTKLRNPHIINHLSYQYSIEHVCPECHILMEYGAGGTLANAVKEEKPSHVLLRSWSHQVLLGVAYLHQWRIVHRDIKGQNIFLSSRDRDTCLLKIGDLEDTKCLITEKSSKEDISFQGSASYLSAEMLNKWMKFSDKEDQFLVGRKTDIWSYGCVILEMLTGESPKYPMPAETEYKEISVDFAKYVLTGGLPALCYRQPEDLEIRDIIKRCLQLRPEDRPGASELLESDFFCANQTCKLFLELPHIA